MENKITKQEVQTKIQELTTLLMFIRVENPKEITSKDASDELFNLILALEDFNCGLNNGTIEIS